MMNLRDDDAPSREEEMTKAYWKPPRLFEGKLQIQDLPLKRKMSLSSLRNFLMDDFIHRKMSMLIFSLGDSDRMTRSFLNLKISDLEEITRSLKSR